MKCLFCSHPETKVTDKRESGNKIRRRRECLKCGKRFTTYEQIDTDYLYVIKKDNRREKFSRQKLESGINRALEKRPVSQQAIGNIINQIEEQLRKTAKNKEIKTSIIGELVMKKLKKLDNIAYIRFASVYRDFKDANDFKRELKELNK